MSTPYRYSAAALLAMSLLAGAVPNITSTAPATLDLLERPGPVTAHGARRLLLDVTPGGPGFLAVGEMGLMLSSTDGQSWQQLPSLAAVMLTALHFPDAAHGWAVGHDGVILATTDGGRHWQRQFDGNASNTAMLAAAQREKAAAEAATPRNEERIAQADDLLASAEDAIKAGPSRPLLGVRFTDSHHGFAVGSFGQLFETDDGGAKWRYIGDRLPNPEGLHLNGIAIKGQALYIAAELGVVFVSIDGGASWRRTETGYTGHLYGVLPLTATEGREQLLAYGFKGHLFRSNDQGSHWNELPSDAAARTWVQGQVQGEQAWLLTEDGRLFTSRDGGDTLTPIGAAPLAARRFAGFTLQGQRLIAVGQGGVSLHTLDKPQ